MKKSRPRTRSGIIRAPETPAKGITPKKKQALLTYMTILFVVAFLLVLLSFFIQLRDSRATISELNESSMNALKNAPGTTGGQRAADRGK